MAARVKKGVGEARRDRGDERKEEREKEGRIARSKRMAWKGRGQRREGEGSTHFHHLYTRRGNGGGGGGGYLVDISVFPIPGVSALFYQFSSSSLPLVCLPTTPDETARRALAVVLSDRA